MCEHEITREVRRFYERVRFPGVRPVDRDGLILMRRLYRLPAGGRVLDAGCGTGNTLVSLARALSNIDFVGMDMSGPSLEIARESAAGLSNVSFVEGDLMRLAPDGPFDLILCLGVLHHTADMERVLGNLRAVMAERGELILWLYGRHGRYRHSLNLRVLDKLMAVDPQTEDAVGLARDFALRLGEGAALEDLFGAPPEPSWKRQVLENDAWVADQFLHPHEQVVELSDIMQLATSAGLEFHEWLGVKRELPGATPELSRRFERLDEQTALCVLDAWLKPASYLVALRPVR